MTLHREMAGLHLPRDLEVRHSDRSRHGLGHVEFTVDGQVIAEAREVWGTRARSAFEMQRNLAMGRLNDVTPTEKVKVWETYTLVGGRRRRAGGNQPDLRHAARFLTRHSHVLHALNHHQNTASTTTE